MVKGECEICEDAFTILVFYSAKLYCVACLKEKHPRIYLDLLLYLKAMKANESKRPTKARGN